MKNFYEIVIIFSPNINEEKLNSYLNKIKSVISSYGEILNEENWGNKKLAYEIKNFSNGIYYFIFCKTEKTSFVNELKKIFSTTEDIIRYGIKKVLKQKEESLKV